MLKRAFEQTEMKKVSRAVAQTIGVCVVSTVYINIASAQNAASPPATNTLERIVVTGSQIPRAEKETPSPVQVISAEELKESGYTTVSEVLRDITANGQGTLSQGFRGFAAGASGVSLRGLTLGATLVLIDGHRMAPYPLSDDGERPFVDISSIPFEAVERIEVLKDGASAVYGSDAIAGVVNVILKKSFKGTSISAETGTTQHGGGSTSRASLMHGFAGPGTEGYVSIEYRKQDAIKVNQRSGDWTQMDWTAQGGENLLPGARNTATPSPRLLTAYLQIPGSSTANAANFAFYTGCTYVQMRASQCTYQDTWSSLQPPSQNINLLGSVTSQLNGGWELNVKASFFDSKSQQVRSPVPIPAGTFAGITRTGPGLIPTIVGAISAFTVPANYPGNTLGVPALVRGLLRPGEGTTTDIDSKSTRVVADLSGMVAGWDFRGAAGYTRVETNIDYRNYLNPGNLLIALNSPDPSTRYLLSGNNSAAVMDFVSPTISNRSTDQLNFIEARAFRELMPLEGGPLSLGIGATYITKDLNAPDPVPNQLGTMVLNGAYAVGKEKNASVYAEVVAPVLKNLELDSAVRFDHYDTYGHSTTPKVGFKFSPAPEISLRGTASQGFRAPSATENAVAGALFVFNNIRDPLLCPISNANGTPDTKAAGNIPAFCNFSPAYLQGTTATLQPERSKSYTLGMILEPVKGWSTTLDYYKIEVNNQIVPAAAQATFNPLAFIVRGAPQQATFGDGSTGLSSVGTIAYINGQTTSTSGIELDTRYKFNLQEYGKLNVGLMITHMLKYSQTLSGVTYELAGTHGPSIIGGDTANPKDRAQLTLAWEHGPFTVTTTTNYISGYDVTDPSNGYDDCKSGIQNISHFFPVNDPPSQYCKVKSFTYTNLSAQYRMSKAWTFSLAVSNLFDSKPPVDLATYGGYGINPSSGGGGLPYNPSMHQIGAVGRFFNVGANYKF